MAVALSYRWGTGRSLSPVDGHSLLPGRSLALVVLIITPMGDRHEVAAPVDGRSIIVQMGDGAKPLPRRWPQLTTRARDRPGSLIITQMGDRHEVVAPVDGRSIIVQMGDGAKPLPRRWPQPTTRARDRPGSPHYYPNGGQARSGCSRRRP